MIGSALTEKGNNMIQIDMEMPKCCMDCAFATADIFGKIILSCTTPAGKIMYGENLLEREDRPKWCPLYEAPMGEAKPIQKEGQYYCAKCLRKVQRKADKFCGTCGQAINWE